MKPETVEFSRMVRIDTIGTTPREMGIGADEAERAALARRFGLVGIDHLSAETSLTRSGDEIRVEGVLHASVTQSCVATELPVPEQVDEEFSLVFRPQHASPVHDEEIELSEGEMDVIFYDGASIDLGEAVAETMSLSLDPYPRSEEAEAALRQAGVKKEEDVAPESPLAGLKDLLAGKKS